jgi:hypothetical protein
MIFYVAESVFIVKINNSFHSPCFSREFTRWWCRIFVVESHYFLGKSQTFHLYSIYLQVLFESVVVNAFVCVSIMLIFKSVAPHRKIATMHRIFCSVTLIFPSKTKVYIFIINI